MDNRDSYNREVLNAACGEPPLPRRPVVLDRANRVHAIAISRKSDVDEAADLADDCAPGRFPAGLGQPAKRSSIRNEASTDRRRSATGKSARIAIKAKGRILFIDAADIISIEAKGNYVLLLHTSGSYMLRESILTMAEKLSRHGFVRVHRSVLVNAALVEEIRPCPSGEYRLRVRGGREFTVTRTYKKNLQLLAQSWIGMKGFAIE